jgi:hypothetical protein
MRGETGMKGGGGREETGIKGIRTVCFLILFVDEKREAERARESVCV